MADFNKYTNYSEKTSFDGVIFGANAPVLEVEMNEVQEIVDSKVKKITNAFGNCVIPIEDGTVAFSEGNLSVKKCVIFSNGFTAFVPSASVALTGGSPIAYFALERKEVTHSSTLKEYGNTHAGTISNPIRDSRVGKETSRRYVITVTIKSGNSLPKDSATVKNVPIGTLDPVNGFVPEFVTNPISDFGFSVHNGMACVTYEKE